jgi:DNA-binding IclR family transcriptional regulator
MAGMKLAEAQELLKLTQVIADAFDRETPLTTVLAFLRIASAGDAGIDQGTLMRQLDISPAGISRTVQTLSAESWLKDKAGNPKPGMDLVDIQMTTGNRGLRTLALNSKGRALVSKLHGALK